MVKICFFYSLCLISFTSWLDTLSKNLAPFHHFNFVLFDCIDIDWWKSFQRIFFFLWESEGNFICTRGGGITGISSLVLLVIWSFLNLQAEPPPPARSKQTTYYKWRTNNWKRWLQRTANFRIPGPGPKHARY